MEHTMRNMRILQVNTRHFYAGGDSTYAFNLADVLRSRGHQVAFFGMQDERNLPDPNADLFVPYVDFRGLNRRKSVVGGAQVLSRVIYSRDARRRFGQMLDRFQPEAVHLQNIHAHITPSVIFEARKRGLPVVWTLHDYKLACPNSHFLIDTTQQVCERCGKHSYYQAVLHRCKKGSLLASGMAALEAYAHRVMRVRGQVDFLLAPSAFLQRKLLERGFSPRQVLHVPHFLREDMFAEATGKNQGYLLFAGRLTTIKGIHSLLESVGRTPEVKLVLAGQIDETLEPELSRLMPPNAEYVGLKHGEELHALLRGAMAMVVPSICYENQPFSILEAFAVGKPVIACNLGGMTELVQDRERGILVPPGDVAALAKAMRWMVAHPIEAEGMGRAALAYARQTHTIDVHYTRLMEIYRHARARRSGGGS
ncbi:MAG: glycosyltransferase [Chloroflexota bacterium]|nr:MAG: glycosyltransferase [Chloroflexota bacterium]